MFQRLGGFIACSRGNIAFMTAGFALPALTLIAGGLEIAEFHRTKIDMQHAADTAVMSAIYAPDRDWSKRVRRANDFFDNNFQNPHKVTRIKRKLRGNSDRKRLVLRYDASADIISLFGELNPFTKNTIRVTSEAELDFRSGRPARLTGSGESTSKSKYPPLP